MAEEPKSPAEQADGGSGTRVWRTDGTMTGTVALTEPFAPGSDFGPLVLHNGRLLFVAFEEAFGSEPWVSDGTVAGTRRVDLCLGPCSSGPSMLAATSKGVVFAAELPGRLREAFLSDGTASGTLSLGDLCSAECRAYEGFVGEVGGRLILKAERHGVESLWASPGVPGAAELLFERDAFPVGIGGGGLGTVGGRLLLNLSDEEHGFEPWRTDGTPEGTELLADLTYAHVLAFE